MPIIGCGAMIQCMKWILGSSLALLMCLSVRAQELTDPAKIIEFSQQKVASYKTFTGEVTLMMRMFGDNLYYAGRVYFRAPGLLREDLTMTEPTPDAGAMLSVTGIDGINWHVDRQRQALTIMKQNMRVRHYSAGTLVGISIDPSGKEPVRLSCGADTSQYQYQFTGIEKLNGVDVYVLEGTPKAAVAAAQKPGTVGAATGAQRVCIGKSDGFIYEMSQHYKDSGKPIRGVEFHNVQFNTNIDDELFRYTPPPGASVVDMATAAKLFGIK